MPVFLYLETNFPISFAMGRSPGADAILLRPSPSLRLIMPSVCFMETFSLFEGETKRHRQRLEYLAQQRDEVRRNVVSPLIPSLAGHLEQARIDYNSLYDEFKARLFQALEILGSSADLIHPTSLVLAASRSRLLISDPTDNLILASILDHSKNLPSKTKIFLSENRRDFDINPDAKAAIRDGGIRYFADASRCLEWHESRPVS